MQIKIFSKNEKPFGKMFNPIQKILSNKPKFTLQFILDNFCSKFSLKKGSQGQQIFISFTPVNIEKFEFFIYK